MATEIPPVETPRIDIIPFEKLQGVSRAAISMYWSDEITNQIDKERQECGLPKQNISPEARQACFKSQHHLIAVKGDKSEFEKNIDEAICGKVPDVQDVEALVAYISMKDLNLIANTTRDVTHSAVGGIIGWRLIPDLYNESLSTAFVSEIMAPRDTTYADDKEGRHEADIDKMLIGQVASSLGNRVPSLTIETSKQGEERLLRPYREMLEYRGPNIGRGIRQMGAYEPMPSGFERGDEEVTWMRGFFRVQTIDLMAAAAKMPNMDDLLRKYTLVYKVPAAMPLAAVLLPR